ncbi:SurA N-terminal domain-containing protein [Cytobacillus horneckiae]|uniref:SurA N-terminal domain-containing protein n=1 Tax=Cytobacillus horneckiae TaxID=549687 RepID=UPI003D211966
MKKLTLLFITGLMIVVLAACGGNEEGKEAKTDDQPKAAEAEQQKQMEEMEKKLEAQQVDEKETVVVVNDKEILGRDYNNVLSSIQMQMQTMGQDPTAKDVAKEVKNQTIDSLVGQTLLLQEADKKGFKASEEEVKKQLEETKKQFKSEKEFEEALKKSGIDLKTLEAQIADGIKFNKYVEKEIPAGDISEEEINKAYDQYAEQGKKAEQEVPKLEEVKPDIEQSLQQQKQQEKLAQHVEELKEKGKIDIKI